MSAAAGTGVNGHLYIGLDFGMALTKVAVWAKLAVEQRPTRFVVEFPKDDPMLNALDQDRAPYVPSALWTANGGIFGVPSPRARTMTRIDGIKRMLLDGWNAEEQSDPLLPEALRSDAGWNAEKLAILKLAFILRHANVAIDRWSAAAHPGARWGKLINAAIPPEEGEFLVSSSRTRRMRWVIERAWVLANRMRSRELGLAISEALSLVDAVYSMEPLADSATPVEVVPEALAAACSHITSDHATPGNWLTVDVGALTTDTAYFFFNPSQDYQIACYSTLRSKQVGMERLAPSEPTVAVKGRSYLPHEAIAMDPTLATSHPDYANVIREMIEAVKATVVGTIRHQGDNVGAVLVDGRPQFRILLVGGGAVHRAVEPMIRNWTFPGLGRVQVAECEIARLPKDIQLLTVDSKLHRRGIAPEDHPLLTLAVGLAQRRIDLPRWRNDDPEPKIVPREAPEHPYLGHN
jgi:hypothetical protein